MSETYAHEDLDVEDEPVTIERQCSPLSGCGETIEVEIHPDGTYEGGIYFGEVRRIEDGADLVTAGWEDDEWIGSIPRATWSDEYDVEFWLHEQCAKPSDWDE